MSSVGQPALRVVRADERPDVAWRNGAGMTRVLAQHPQDAGYDDFVWRVSLAQIARSGPFSRFPGVVRHFVALGDVALALTVDGHRHELARFDVIAFSGEAETSCELQAGATALALNVMVRRGPVTATVGVHSEVSGLELRAPSGGQLGIVALEVGVEVRGVGELGRFDAVWCRDGERLRAAGLGHILVVTVGPSEGR